MDDKQLIEGILKGNKRTFELLYKNYYVFLCLIAEQITRSHSDAEEIVSDVFLKLWNNRQNLDIKISLKYYLTKAVQNTSINYLEKKTSEKAISLDSIPYDLLAWDNNYPLGKLFEEELNCILERGIYTLPEGCREIFLLCRNEELSYSEVAQKLGISVNTVKTQMKIALVRLREVMKDYLHLLVIIISLKNI